MLYMLDTDISSYIIRKRPETVLKRFESLPMESICISVVTHAELLYGVAKSSSSRINRTVIDTFIQNLSVMEWNSEAAEHYAKIRSRLEHQGKIIGNMDLMIAAHARSLSAVLVTNNKRDFERVPGIKIENWV